MEVVYTYDSKPEDHPPHPSSSGLFWKSIQSYDYKEGVN